MAKGKKFSGRTPVVSLAAQNLQVQRRFAGFTFTWQMGEGIWRGTLQPQETSPSYQVVIRYKVGSIPKVKVASPPLRAGAPHLYAGAFLCLYWPKEWGWSRSEVVAETIIPWTALWLYYYELWCDTGEWLGPSSPHGPGPKEEKPRVA